MKTFYAVGDKRCRVPVLIHSHQSRTGANCSFFPPCPVVHLDAIPKNMGTDNYHKCESFTLFESLEDAKKFALNERFNNYSGGPELFLIFKVQAEENLLPEVMKEKGTICFTKISPERISKLDESIVDQESLFSNTTPDFVHRGGCTIL